MQLNKPRLKGSYHTMKVIFVLPNAAIGGVEKVRLALMRHFVDIGIECHLALRKRQGELLSEIPSAVRIHELAPTGMYEFIPTLIRLLRKEKPTHIITAFPDIGVLVWASLTLTRSYTKWIHSADNTHSSVAWRYGYLGRLRSRAENCMTAFIYKHSDAIVAVSNGVRDEILENYKVSPSRVKTIYNPVIDYSKLLPISRDRLDKSKQVNIVTLGRLVKQKGVDVLIEALATLPGNWRLDIWGDGPEYPNLDNLIRHYGLEKKIRLRGYTSKPIEILREADIFVMASRHEGLGNTLIEALACQCQVIATDCPHGPKEILMEGILGQLVPVENPESITKAIIRIMDGSEYVEPKLLANRAAHFSRTESCEQWVNLLASL